MLPEVVSNAVQAQGPLLDALAGLGMLFALVLATSALAHRFEVVEKTLQTSPTIVIDHGRILEDALNHERVTPEELFSEMRKQGIENLSEVAWGVLESSGTITFIPTQNPSRSRQDDDVPQ